MTNTGRVRVLVECSSDADGRQLSEHESPVGADDDVARILGWAVGDVVRSHFESRVLQSLAAAVEGVCDFDVSWCEDAEVKDAEVKDAEDEFACAARRVEGAWKSYRRRLRGEVTNDDFEHADGMLT